MRVWLIQIGEPLPTDPGNQRLLRTGILAGRLADRTHDVTWWTSTFDHTARHHRAGQNHEQSISGNYRIRMLRATGYRRNISISRLVDHRLLALRFRAQARLQKPPDVIVCSYPTPELAVEAVRYGREHDVPVVMDIRDIWPDMMIDSAPSPLRGVVSFLTAGMRREARLACRGAASIMGNAPAFVKWGVDHAGRPATALDRAFPFGYDPVVLRADQETEVRAFWAEHGIQDDGRLTLCFVGTIGHQMDLETVLQAARVLETSQRIRLVLCGVGERLEALRAAAADLSSVVFPGWVDRPRIAGLMGLASVACMPYRERKDFLASIPNKGPEYMAGGLPIALSLGSGAMYDLLQEHECGFSYEGDADILVQWLNRLDSDRELLRAMSVHAYQLYQDQFRADMVYSDMIDYLEGIALRAS